MGRDAERSLGLASRGGAVPSIGRVLDGRKEDALLWRLIRSPARSAAENMALDEALLLGGGSPVLRLYSWEPPALSLGYFQRLAEVDRGALARHGLDLVRRPTGGGAIAHVDELTFCFVAPEGVHPYSGGIAASYERVHHALAAGLARLGLRARLRGRGAGLQSDSGEGAGFYCFYHSAIPDLEVNKCKLLGSAQRRRKGRVLHHGSLPLRPNPLTPLAASVAATMGRDVAPDEVAAALLEGLREELGLAFEEGEPSAHERELASSLHAKYASRDFTARR